MRGLGKKGRVGMLQGVVEWVIRVDWLINKGTCTVYCTLDVIFHQACCCFIPAICCSVTQRNFIE